MFGPSLGAWSGIGMRLEEEAVGAGGDRRDGQAAE